MLVLGLETSTAAASVALVDGDGLLGEMFFNTGRHVSRQILSLISLLLKQTGVEFEDLEGIAVALGPGSFTGLRVGVATAKALSHASGKPLAGVPTLDALALNAAGVTGLICPVVVARREEVYTALYRWQEGRLCRLIPYQAVTPASWVGYLASYNEPVYFLGDGVQPFEESWESLKEKAVFLPPENSFPRAAHIARLGRERLSRGERDDIFQLKPLYLRPPAAVYKEL
ncbi:MAG: tRNA (adenosine(37)-N6)-threonylcarbamoyltransferase complex dimerization subunit type 1 TsaB [Thermanaeromonas sp.]|uniref:tRNA (adenosine(37)-N6)-threonylcarbamoyltransferase complex dimerization subunit type 1 TsaB n=1 Tax=Thermanaeromonas sp. TaxID=2003697 RepID=UPI0024388C53|nr:tRNA (adenosine(37)-N6)-threonylcarbamoyltransferase complex dimerization subunit type 1 TsaB [Thermanaeromonas sp.]MCG0278761.1 tRNA (adenosine(37)-N6)-threonylcarbamoyltransferase complex dimerization subunit type 1 TsaB [Thermanaeromonas sp.]